MLRQYGVSVDEAILTKLVSAFSELRQMADDGLIAYPYSTREVVNIVKHIEVSIMSSVLLYSNLQCTCYLPMKNRLPKLSQCTSLKTQSIFRHFGLMLRPSSGSVIQNSTKNDTW